jgi:formylglycine-generating enzyme required for sulfatase activity
VLSGWVTTLVTVLPIFLGGSFAASSEDKPLQPGQTFRDCSECPEMVVVPAGSFLMGASDEETKREFDIIVPDNMRWYVQKAMASEHPQHRVSIDRSFALGKYRVTRGEFAAFVRENRIFNRRWLYPLDR